MDMNRRKFFKIAAAATGTAACAVASPAQARDRVEIDPEWNGMLNDSTLCIGCKACQSACKTVNKLPADPTLGEKASVGHDLYDSPRGLTKDTYTLIEMHKEGKDGEPTFIKRQCMHCIDPACQSACIVGALKKTKSGDVEYNSGRCMGCRYCMVACPFSVPQFEWDKAIPSITKCTLCKETLLKDGKPTACSTVCPTGAVTFGKRTELVKIAQKRIDENPEKYAKNIYGIEEVGGTGVIYLGPQKVTYAALGLPDFGYRPASELTESIQHRIFQYFIPPVAIYGVLGGVMAYNNRKKKQKGIEGGDDEY